MKSLFISALLLVGFCACNKQSKNISAKNIPPCIAALIDQLKKEPKHNPPAIIYEYTYNNQKVYYVTADCCDQYNLLYDSNCNVLCAPDGGFTGRGDGRCADFVKERKDERLIWKDER